MAGSSGISGEDGGVISLFSVASGSSSFSSTLIGTKVVDCASLSSLFAPVESFFSLGVWDLELSPVTCPLHALPESLSPYDSSSASLNKMIIPKLD